MMQMMKRFDDRYNRLDTIPAFDRRTDRNGKTIGLSRAAYHECETSDRKNFVRQKTENIK